MSTRSIGRLLRTSSVALVLAVVAATMSFASPASAAGHHAAARPASEASERLSGGISNFAVEPNENSLFITADPWCTGLYRSCNAWVEFPGYSVKNVNPRGGYFAQWPSAWAPGATATVSIRYYLIDTLGFAYYGTPPQTKTITRPKPFTALTAAVYQVDQTGRSAGVRGTATNGAEIRYRGAGVAISNGQWAATVGGLQVGRNDLTFEQWVDGSYRDSKTVTVTIDAPTPQLTATGSFPSDTTQRARISGVAGKGATVVISSGGSEVARVQASSTDGSYVWDAPAPMSGGSRAYVVSQIINGNASGNVPVTFDYGSAVAITTPADQSEQPAGPTTIRGNGETGSTVTVALNGADLPSTTVANGTWSVTADLRRGQNTLLATQRSKGANVTTSSSTVNPGVPANDPLTVAVGAVDHDARSAVVSGTATPSAQIRVGATTIATVGIDGTWTGRVTGLALGANRVEFTQDVDGQRVDAKTVEIRVVRTAFAVTSPADQDVVVAPDGAVTFVGTGRPGAKVSVLNGQRVVGSATVLDDGTWRFTAVMAYSRYDLTAYHKRDPAGPVSDRVPLRITVTGGAVLLPFSVTSPTDGSVVVTPDRSVRFTGDGAGRGRVVVRRGNATVAEGVVGDDGKWTLTGLLNYGEQDVTVFHKPVGAARAEQVALHLTVRAPAAEFEITDPADGDTVESGQVTFTGIGRNSTAVSVFVNGKPRGTTTIVDGKWTLTTSAISAGTHDFVVYHKQGAAAAQSETVRLTLR